METIFRGSIYKRLWQHFRFWSKRIHLLECLAQNLRRENQTCKKTGILSRQPKLLNINEVRKFLSFWSFDWSYIFWWLRWTNDCSLATKRQSFWQLKSSKFCLFNYQKHRNRAKFYKFCTDPIFLDLNAMRRVHNDRWYLMALLGSFISNFEGV